MSSPRIERIGSGCEPAGEASAPGRRIRSAPTPPGIRRLEWHEAPTPDGAFVRLPVPGLVVILNVATCGAWRPDPRAAWRAQPAASVRGLALRPSHGRDSATGALGYVSVVLRP